MLGKRNKPSKNSKQQDNKKKKIKNLYEGFIPKKGWQIETIQSNIDPKDFFENFVKQRKPVLINQHPDGKISQFSWNREYMIEKAGKSEIFVEKRDSVREQFGTGKSKVKMNFKDYLNIEEEKDKYYMTTQKIPYDNIGPKYITDTPIIHLLKDEDYRIPLIGNLIPNQLNMWMGFSGKQGSQTGLHIDYHDNIYVLVKGNKLFNISPPVSATELELNGDVKVIHKNGLIVYNNEIHSDGHYSDSDEEIDEEEENQDQEEQQFGKITCPKQLKAQISKLESQIEQMNEQKNQINDSEELKKHESKLAEVESKLEQLLDQQLDFAFEGDQFDDFDNDDGDKYSDQEEPLQADPDNFVVKRLQNKHLFSKVANIFPVEIKEGQMLYLPASWYHQVNSFGDFHFAYNIWMHPPNNDQFEKPYKSDYWVKRYELMKKNTDNLKAKLEKEF